MKLTPWISGLLMLVVCAQAADKITLRNGDFEQGQVDWRLFVPKESVAAGCRFTVETTEAHSGSKAALLTTAKPARFGIHYSQPTPITVKAGQHYRLIAWVKAGADFVAGPDSAGPVIRATLSNQQMKEVAGGHIFVSLQGVQRSEPALLDDQSVPTEWTKIEGDIEIPAGASTMTLFVFCWKTSGTLWIDDVSMIEASTHAPAAAAP